VEQVKSALEAKTYLHKGLHVVFRDGATGDELELAHDGGISDYLTKIVAERGKPGIQPQTFYLAKEDPRVEVALGWTESTEEHIRSYVNGIQTGAGGTHEQGL